VQVTVLTDLLTGCRGCVGRFGNEHDGIENYHVDIAAHLQRHPCCPAVAGVCHVWVARWSAA
jgi:hypothetical protein